MRGSIVVLALAIAPWVTSVSNAQDAASTSTSSRPMCQKDPGNPSATGEANRTKKCPPPVATGKVTISGIVFFDLEPYDGLYDPANENGIAGWTVVLSGPTGQLTYNTAADPNNPGVVQLCRDCRLVPRIRCVCNPHQGGRRRRRRAAQRARAASEAVGATRSRCRRSRSTLSSDTRTSASTATTSRRASQQWARRSRAGPVSGQAVRVPT